MCVRGAEQRAPFPSSENWLAPGGQSVPGPQIFEMSKQKTKKMKTVISTGTVSGSFAVAPTAAEGRGSASLCASAAGPSPSVREGRARGALRSPPALPWEARPGRWPGGCSESLAEASPFRNSHTLILAIADNLRLLGQQEFSETEAECRQSGAAGSGAQLQWLAGSS